MQGNDEYLRETRAGKRNEALELARALALQAQNKSSIVEKDEDELMWAKEHKSDAKFSVAVLNTYREQNKYLLEWPTVLKNILSANSHIYVFSNYGNLAKLTTLFQKEGYNVFPTPIIHFITDSVYNPWPDYGPRHSWEAILFIMLGKRKSFKTLPDVVSAEGGEVGARRNSTLYLNLLSRSCKVGTNVVSLGVRDAEIKKAAMNLNINLTFVRKQK